MSDMKPKGTPLDVGGRTYELLFNLNVLEEVCTKYGSLTELLSRMSGKTDSNADDNEVAPTSRAVDDVGELVRTLSWLLTTMINESLDIAGEAPITQKHVKRMFSPRDIVLLKTALIEAINNGMPDVDEDDSAEPDEGSEDPSKNP